MNKHLLSFFLGVVVTAGAARFGFWGLNRDWEMRAVSKGYGLFTFNIYDKPDWDGNQPLKFYWKDENPKQWQVDRTTTPLPSRPSEAHQVQLPMTPAVETVTPKPAPSRTKLDPNR
jgi:hypothetical protein